MYIDQVQDLIRACQWDTTDFLVVSQNVFDPFIYYSHILPLIASVTIGFFVLFKNPTQLLSRVLFTITGLFSLWVFFDLILWATDRPDYTMFFWAIVNLIEPFIYATSLYFIQVFVGGRDTTLRNKIIILLPLLPFILLVSSRFTLLGYDLTNCNREAIEGPLTHYAYLVEVFYTLWIVVYSMESYRKARIKTARWQIIVISIGIILFLLTFSFGNIIGSITDDWRMPQWGIFGMPIFIGFLSYLIVKYKAFDIKLIATQAIAVVISILIGSQFFFIKDSGNHILNGVTFLISVVGGILLVRSVKLEIEAKEREHEQLQKIQSLANNLELANKGQESLIHLMNHQIKGYLGKGRSVFAELLTGDYGVIPAPASELIKAGFEQTSRGLDYVQSILRGASAQTGTLPFDMKFTDLEPVARDLIEQQRVLVEKSNLKFDGVIAKGDYRTICDSIQVNESFKNLVTNAIKYNRPNGAVSVSLRVEGNYIVFSVKDTGIGITEEDKHRLFTPGGMGKNSIKYNTDASGFGLAFVKGVALAHKGEVGYQSNSPKEGGTTFYFKLPIRKPGF